MKYIKPSTLFLIAGLVLLFAFGVSAEPSATEKLEVAKQQLLEARRGHCSIIGARVSKCYEGDTSECSQMHKSIAWFMSQYGETPEVACQSDTAFLEGGA